jgi:Lon protease-like protein
MPLRLPLFPLGVVLFPGVLLPLHVFEPRYRRLLQDIADGERQFGLLLPGIGREAPAAGAVGTIAELRATQPLAEGRSNIVVQGGQRFMVSRYVDDEAPYLVAMVEPFEDRDDAPVSANALAELTAEFQRYDTARRALHDVEPDDEPLPTEAAPLSFRVAGGMELDLVEQRRLLELRSTQVRVERLLELLPPLVRSVEAGAAVHRRAGRNGKGHMHPGLTEDA